MASTIFLAANIEQTFFKGEPGAWEVQGKISKLVVMSLNLSKNFGGEQCQKMK